MSNPFVRGRPIETREIIDFNYNRRNPYFRDLIDEDTTGSTIERNNPLVRGRPIDTREIIDFNYNRRNPYFRDLIDEDTTGSTIERNNPLVRGRPIDTREIIDFNYNRRNPYFRDLIDEDTTGSKCKLCNIPVITPDHQASTIHRFNFYLWQWKNYRKALTKNRNGIEVIETFNNIQNSSKPESFIVQSTVAAATAVNNKFTFNVKIKNKGEFTTTLLNVQLIYPYDSFRMDSSVDFTMGNFVELNQDSSFQFKVIFELSGDCIGHFKMPFIMHFCNLNNETDFYLMRQVEIIISDDAVDLSKSPKRNRAPICFDGVIETIPAVNMHYQSRFQVPKQFRNALELGLNENRSSNSDELALMKLLKVKMGANYPNRSHYSDYFHFVLWMEEIAEEVMTSQFNLENVTMNAVNEKNTFELVVEGLAEKRPSLVRNDVVIVREHRGTIAYQGKITKVFDKSVWIEGFNVVFSQKLFKNQKMKLDVSFVPNRITYERSHFGIEYLASDSLLLQSLFSEQANHQNIQLRFNFKATKQNLFNKGLYNNSEQIQAVENIVSGTSGIYPYIIFGPPGTGKTITMVEAILQIKKLDVKCNILVCAPSNAACNMLTSKLIEYGCTPKELIRIHSTAIPWENIPEDVREYSNFNDEKYTAISGNDLKKYRIVITTLSMSGRYLEKREYSPTYVFIDEAAQAIEPEVVIPIAMISKNHQLVLAGDPKQLGPIVISKVAQKYFLNISLLQRLMSTSELYLDNNPLFITMLRSNFRSHPEILNIPNKLFYNNQLNAQSISALDDPIARICVYPLINANYNRSKSSAAVEFYAIICEEKREGNSPSYFNPEEVNLVGKTVDALLTRVTVTKIRQEEIGVITPYISQVHKIKAKLSHYGYSDVEVGSTETFQGREKRIIIISTVRAKKSLILYDAMYKLGFVKNAQRFNVCLTRAMSKLIVIGCPNVLRYDKENWLEYIDYCCKLNSYFGAPFDRRSDEIVEDVINRFNNIKLK